MTNMFADYFKNRKPNLKLEPGQKLFNEGEKADRAFIVHSGVVELFVKENLLRAMGPGEILGEMALVDDDTRQATAVAGSEGAALFGLDKDEFVSLSLEKPEFSAMLMKVVSGRLREMNRDFIIYKSTLENMSDGVLTLDLTGHFIACNEAATQILGIAETGDDLIGKSVDEIFDPFEHEVNEDFFQLILEAIGAEDMIQNRVVTFQNQGQSGKLFMTTSFLQTDKGGQATRNGVIIVFRDITEIERLREAESELSVELKTQHEQLQSAYVNIEENNHALESNLKKIQTLRVFATAFVVILFVAIGLYSWDKRPSFTGASSDTGQSNRQKLVTMIAAPKQVSTIGSVKAEMLPIEEKEIKSSVSGVIDTVFFVFGQPVVEGYKLLSIDNS
jgi:PAS domain S-box-containing protein